MLLLSTNATAQNVDETPDAFNFIAVEASLEPAPRVLTAASHPTEKKSRWQEMALGKSSRSLPLEGVRR
jgi:hypothetical protein